MNYPTTQNLAEILVRNGIVQSSDVDNHLKMGWIALAAMELRHRILEEPKQDDGLCSGDCPHLLTFDAERLLAACLLYRKPLDYYDGFHAVCNFPGAQNKLHSDVNTPAKPGPAVAGAGKLSPP